MSQSLPRLSAFLRPAAARADTDEQPRHPAQPDFRDNKRPMPDAAPGSVPTFGGIGGTTQDAMYAAEPPRKRRSNMFVQYGETAYGAAAAAYHRQQESPMQLHQPAASAGLMHARPQLSHPAVYHEQASLMEIHRSGRPYTPDTHRPQQQRDANAVTPVTADASNGGSPQPPRVQPRERTSRYLSEEDRREIILRIDKGEKQVALAKEYQVSRAAICNLYKNRREVMIRVDRNPKAKHPKRSKTKDASAVPAVVMEDAHPERGGGTPPLQAVVTAGDTNAKEPTMDDEHSDCSTTSNVSSNEQHSSTVWKARRPSDTTVVESPELQGARVLSETSLPIRRLIETLGDRRLPLATVRRTTKRILHGLFEEAAACIAQRCQDQPACSDSDIIGVSLEEPSGLMLQTFASVFESSSAFMASENTWAKGMRLTGRAKAVILMDKDSSSGERARVALRHLTQREGMLASRIAFVSWFSSRATLHSIHADFPDVVILSATVHSESDPSQGHALADISNRFLGAPFSPPSATSPVT
ncbi:hypothetical protein ATCC90586_001414 [Pythium insidiosum]|nr:hypothetical protein ATCC90586_001414 [Pythium insidiosum]